MSQNQSQPEAARPISHMDFESEMADMQTNNANAWVHQLQGAWPYRLIADICDVVKYADPEKPATSMAAITRIIERAQGGVAVEQLLRKNANARTTP